jgi:UDP-glucose 4-epimerase
VGVQRETSLKELLQTLLKVNSCELEPVFKEANSVNPVKKRIADLTKINKLLGYQPSITLEGGLKALSEWYFNLQKQEI